MSVVFHEGPPRGFLSTYVSLLAAYRNFIGTQGIDYKEIHISPDNFQFYGFNPQNWFDVLNLSDGEHTSIHQNTAAIYGIEEYPTIESLNLASYSKFIPYNENTKNFLTSNVKPLNNCLGVHWRGTDHAPHGMIDQNTMLNAIRQQLETNAYDQLFICSEQHNLIETISDCVRSEFNFHNIVVNDVMRSNEIPIFYANVDKVRLGLEVLLDCHMLSACKFVLCKSSNVITYARILNIALEGFYLDQQKYFFSR